MTLLGDDLYAHQPLCHLVLKAKLNFIFVCKPDSHPKLYEWLDYLQAKPDEALPTLTHRHWNGQFVEGPIAISSRFLYALARMPLTLTGVN